MKSYRVLIALLMIAVLASAAAACSNTEPSRTGFGIYLVETGELIISEKHIESYNSSIHAIALNAEGIEHWNDFVASYDTENTTTSPYWCIHEKEFSVKLEGEEIYTGKFWSGFSSLMPEGIVIDFLPELSDEFNILWIMSFTSDDNDSINDPRIIDFFESEGLLSDIEANASSFGIYLVETGELILSDEHIASYDTSGYEIELNEEGIEQWNSYITTTPPTLVGSLFSKEFSLRVNEEEIYQGTFWSWASSATCDGVTIIESLFKLDDEYNTIYIDYNCIDPRDDWRIFHFFESEPEQSTFGIYLVETGELILSDEHIASYDTSGYEIELNEEGIEQWNSFITSQDPVGSGIAGTWLYDKHFALKIDGEEIYGGSFWSTALSTIPLGEATINYNPWPLDDEFNTIGISYHCLDPRNDPRIIEFFDSEGLLEN